MADLDLLGGRGRQRDADGVADALRQQDAERRRALDGPLEGGPGLGHPEVERPVAALGELPVGLHHHDRVVVLDRDLEVVEVVLLEQRRLPHRRLHEGFRRRLAVLLQQPLVEGAGVDADAQRDAGVLRRAGDRADLVVELADVAGIHANGRAPRVDGLEDVLGLEVDVGDDRDLALLRDDVQHVRIVLTRHCDTHDLASGCGQLGDLLEGRVDVGRRRRRHRLHADRRVAAHQHLPHADLPAPAPGREHVGDTRHTDVHCGHLFRVRRGAPRTAAGGRSGLW